MTETNFTNKERIEFSIALLVLGFEFLYLLTVFFMIIDIDTNITFIILANNI